MIGPSQRLGALMVACGFLVYLLVGVTSLLLLSDLSRLTIVGTLFVAFGANKILEGWRADPLWKMGTNGALLGALIAGVMAHFVFTGSAKGDLSTFQRYLILATIQSVFLTLGGGIALLRRSAPAVRALVGLSVVGNLAYGLLLLYSADQVAARDITYLDFNLRAAFLMVLDCLLIIPAVLYAAQRDPSAPDANTPRRPALPPPGSVRFTARTRTEGVPATLPPTGPPVGLRCLRCGAPKPFGSLPGTRCSVCHRGA